MTAITHVLATRWIPRYFTVLGAWVRVGNHRNPGDSKVVSYTRHRIRLPTRCWEACVKICRGFCYNSSRRRGCQTEIPSRHRQSKVSFGLQAEPHPTLANKPPWNIRGMAISSSLHDQLKRAWSCSDARLQRYLWCRPRLTRNLVNLQDAQREARVSTVATVKFWVIRLLATFIMLR
jgi:hypothetical protein